MGQDGAHQTQAGQTPGSPGTPQISLASTQLQVTSAHVCELSQKH